MKRKMHMRLEPQTLYFPCGVWHWGTSSKDPTHCCSVLQDSLSVSSPSAKAFPTQAVS